MVTLYAFCMPWIVATGACVGSFLNVCIWRLPRGESLTHPPSHCPRCGHKIRAWENVPILSYLFLRGKCAECHLPISMRYPTIEAITTIIFVLVWTRVWYARIPVGLAVEYFYLGAALLAISLIDTEHTIIPNALTYPGIVLAFVLAVVFPRTFDLGGPWSTEFARESVFVGPLFAVADTVAPSLAADPRGTAVLHALGGALTAFGILWMVRGLGSIFWGRASVSTDEPIEMSFTADRITIDDVDEAWEDLLYKRSHAFRANIVDILETETADGADELPARSPAGLTVTNGTLTIGDTSIPLASLKHLRVRADSWTMPREAMGIGDLKLMVMLGAMLGAEPALFILMVGSLSGTVIGLFSKLLRPRQGAVVIPFGPFLAFGAYVWMFLGPELLSWYQGILLRLALGS